MNNTMELPYPEWQGSLVDVLAEFDRQELAEKALRAESQILERLNELQRSGDSHDERAAIDSGLSLLRKIMRVSLGYLDWR